MDSPSQKNFILATRDVRIVKICRIVEYRIVSNIWDQLFQYLRIRIVSTGKSEDSRPEKNLSALGYAELPPKNVYFTVCDPEFPWPQ